MIGNFAQSITSETSNVAVYTSGGTDSTMLLYMLCKELKEITAVHVTDINRPYGIINFEEIIDLFKEEFSDVNIKTRFESYDQRITGNKSPFFRKLDRDLFENHGIDFIYLGTTRNPSPDISQKHNLTEGRDVKRDRLVITDKRYIVPFKDLDKKFIADYYKTCNFLQNIFPLTISCIEKVGPCKKCWWCREKKWAFGVHDGESMV